MPNPALTLYDDAVACWRGETMGEWKRNFIRSHHGFPIHRPYADLTDDERATLWVAIREFFDWVESRRQKVQYRVMLARYRGRTVCPECGGSRLRREAGYVRVGGATITELVRKPVADLAAWFASLELEASRRPHRGASAGGDTQPSGVSLRGGPGLSHARPTEQHLERRRKPAHKSGYIPGQQSCGVAIYS